MLTATTRTERDHDLDALGAQTFDLLIIGGGITGATLAALATAGPRPLRVALVEAATLASGTSSRSSKFLHGGLRYLAHGRVGLVRRLLAGRAELAAVAPHLVSPAPFLLPLGPQTPHPTWLLRSALGLYGLLERGGTATRAAGLAPARYLDARVAARAEPLAATLATFGALEYGELAVDDAGLVAAIARRAADAGALVVNRVVCEALVRDAGRVVGARLRDAVTGVPLRVRARAVVDATGPWSGTLDRRGGPPLRRSPLRLSRGTHLLVSAQRLPLARTLVFFGPRDGRALFASPRGAHVLVGTTEVPHTGGPDTVAPSRDEIAYLMNALAAAVPTGRLGAADILGAFAGVRPLADGSGDADALDRGYVVSWDEPGLLALRGGKLTLALDGARRALAALRAQAEALGLPSIVVPPVGALSATSVARAPSARHPALLPVPEPIAWRVV